MSEYLIQDTTLTGIADAIREKTGGTDPVAVSDMAAQIGGIQAGGGDIDALIDRSLTEIESDARTVGPHAFYDCDKLTTVNFPVAKRISAYAFYRCESLTTVNFPAVTYITDNVFNGCSALTTVNFPVATSINSYAFRYCSALTTVTFPAVTSINSNALNGCDGLIALVLCNVNAVCSLGSVSAFSNTPIKSGTGYIYVPSALIEQYKVATNWSTYAAQFRALEDYTVDGTTTGELDPAKTGT